MTTRIHARWQHAADLHRNLEPVSEPVDLATPGPDAAALAEKLQAAHTQITFIRVIHFLGKWVLRPIFWWPLKYYGKALWWVSKSSPKEPRYTNKIRSDGSTESVYY